MSSKRPAILMGTLLLVLLGWFIQQHFAPTATVHPYLAPLPGKNSISNLQVHQDAMGAWTANFDYFFTGEPHAHMLYIEVAPPADPPKGRNPNWFGLPPHSTFVPDPGRGLHHVSIPLGYPGREQTTHTVSVTLWGSAQHSVIAQQQVAHDIDWPAFSRYIQDQLLSRNTPDQNLHYAQELIDTEEAAQFPEARSVLERLIRQNPRFDPAYVELARLAIKSGGESPESLHQAETLLASALEIRPDSANAKILLGLVYTYQRHFDKADELYRQAAATQPPNAWLWTNWGELLVAQNKPDQAITKFREAIARPITHDSYDRGRKYAYRKLVGLLRQKKDLDGIEVLYKQQVAEYGPGSCYSADYARFMLQVRGDTEGAIDLARRALNKDCDDAPSREVLGLAEYVQWAETKGPERVASLNEARIYLPAGPMPLYLLATSERTAPAAKELIASGERIDQQDSYGRTALLYALEHDDLAAARRLLTLHARADIPVGAESVPLALIPVLQGGLAEIRLLREFGVNYSKLRFRGMTAVEYARQSHNRGLLDALGDSGTVL